jgi:hypothetical protein
MNKVEEIAKEVSPTSFEQINTAKAFDYSDVIDSIVSNIDRGLGDEVLRGRAKQGNVKSDSLALIRSFLLEEIDNLNLAKDSENTVRIANDKFKDGLRKQLNTIISILELSIERKDIKHYMVGALLKSL